MLAEENSYKVVLLGNSGVGKTSILNYTVSNSPSTDSVPTIGCNCSILTMNIDAKEVRLKVWDTAGQELYRSIVPIYVRDTFAAILVYDLTEPKSAQALEHWHSVLMEEQTDDVMICVVCNKTDLEDQGAVDDQVGIGIAEKLRGRFFKVSARTGSGIRDLFEAIARAASGSACFSSQKIIDTVGAEPRGCC